MEVNRFQCILALLTLLWAAVMGAQSCAFIDSTGWYKVPLRGLLALVHFLFADLGLMIFIGLGEGCEGAVAYAGTISRISASIYPEGYVFMMVSMVILAYMFLGEVEFVAKNHRERILYDQRQREHNVIGYHVDAKAWLVWSSERVIRTGFGMITITAVIPDGASNFPKHLTWVAALSVFHIIGIVGGIVVSSVGCWMRVYASLSMLPGKPGEGIISKVKPSPVVRNALIVILFGILAVACSAVVFVSAPSVDARLAHICINHETREQCEGTPFAQRGGMSEMPKWPCVWDEAAHISGYACTNPMCGEHIDSNRRALLAEYLLLLYWVLVCSWCLMLVQSIEVDKTLGPSEIVSQQDGFTMLHPPGEDSKVATPRSPSQGP